MIRGGGARTADYDFTLPPDRIAQHPAARRDESRLLVVDRARGTLTHARFSDLAALIPKGDAIVLNTSRVIRARLLGTRETGGACEVLLLEERPDGWWEAMVRPGAKLKPGARVTLGADASVVIGARPERGLSASRLVRLVSELSRDDLLQTYGHVPLPPYIDRADTADDDDRYQTVYARESGSVAAPTAGLHFTTHLLDTLAVNGVRRANVVLHVGMGTFRPVEADEPSKHVMHFERYRVDDEAARTVNETRDAGAHVWAVGTTSLRVLESAVDERGRIAAGDGVTNVFIRPPQPVRGADRLITNFHLPRSTLLMLVAAFAGYDLTMHAYRVAIAEGYRFYSYGDAMCVT